MPDPHTTPQHRPAHLQDGIRRNNISKKQLLKMVDTIDDPYFCEVLITQLTKRCEVLKRQKGIKFNGYGPKEIKVIGGCRE